MTDWHASDYHRQSALQRAMAEEQLSQLVLQGTERILDVGCGDGKISAEIAARVPAGSVLGVDPSQNMIAFASSRFDSSQVPNIRFEVADVQHLSFQKEFDLVVSFNALHWVKDHSAALRSIRNALKPAGRVLLRFVPNGPRKSLKDVFEDIRNTQRWTGYFRNFHRPYVHFTPEKYRQLVEQQGFRIERLGVEDKAWDFKTREEFFDFSRATFVEWTQFLPDEERPAFISEVLDRYATFAANDIKEANTFKFYQMEIFLAQ
jgi:trans-aconitate methyltransferase